MPRSGEIHVVSFFSFQIDALAKTSQGTVTQVPTYAGDASKVVVKGAGLNKFFPGRPAVFNVETGLAGNTSSSSFVFRVCGGEPLAV